MAAPGYLLESKAILLPSSCVPIRIQKAICANEMTPQRIPGAGPGALGFTYIGGLFPLRVRTCQRLGLDCILLT